MDSADKSASKKRNKKPKGDASDVTDDLRNAEPSMESELSSADESSTSKKFKPGSPAARRAAERAAAKVSESTTAVVTETTTVNVTGDFIKPTLSVPLNKADKKKKKKSIAASNVIESSTIDSSAVDDNLEACKRITEELLDVVMSEGVDKKLGRQIVAFSSKYEMLLLKIMMENERLKGRNEAAGNNCMRSHAPLNAGIDSRSRSTREVAVRDTGVPPVVSPKPVETWSVVVRGRNGATSEEVVQKVVKEVGPSLGVRVHEVKPLRDGGAVVRTPSVAEREKIAANSKFKEVGLDVTVKDKLPRLVVQRVHPEITPEDLMSDLYSLNLVSSMSLECFKSTVRIMSKPWKATGGPVNVVIEGPQEVIQTLLDIGRVYIKWFSFVVRQHDTVPNCFRCLSFDHMVRDCRMKEAVCRLCGKGGHVATHCENDVCCRNCSFKGRPSGHLMMSMACPLYATLVARAGARH